MFPIMNFVEMILPASSDNSLAEIYILFVKNSTLLSMFVIREDIIDKVLLLMSISDWLILLRLVKSLNLLKLFQQYYSKKKHLDMCML